MILTTLLLAFLAVAPEGTATEAPAPHWKYIASDGAVVIIHVRPEHARDKRIYAEAVAWVFNRLGDTPVPFQVDFFDDEKDTPTTRQYNDRNRACQRARYNYNPKTGMKRFLWIEPSEPGNPAAGRKGVEDTLPLPPLEENETGQGNDAQKQ